MVKCYIGAVAEPVVLISVTAAAATAELEVAAVDLHTMFRDLAQDKATVAEADKHSTKAALHQTATPMLDSAATVVQTQAVVVAVVDHITAQADRE
jgi:hypothetical protein